MLHNILPECAFADASFFLGGQPIAIGAELEHSQGR